MDENVNGSPEMRQTKVSFVDTLKRFRFLLFFFGLLLLLAAILQSLGGFTSLQLYYLGLSSKPAGLVNYIEDHYQNENDSKHLEQAAQIIINKEMQPGMDYLYEGIFSDKFGQGLSLTILRTMHDNKALTSAPSVNTLIVII